MRHDDPGSLFFENHPEPMWIFDRETLRVLAVNEAAIRDFGYTQAEFLGMTIADLMLPEDVGRLYRIVDSIGDGLHGSDVWRLKCSTGALVHVDIRWRALDFEGRAAVLASIRDITGQVKAEQKLTEAARLLRMAGRTARLGGWRVELDSGRMEWSAETAMIHEEPAGHSPSVEDGIAYYAPEHRDRISRVFSACAQQGRPFDEVLQIITAKGNRVWVRSIGEPERDAEGRIIAVQGAFQDVTELIDARSRSETLSRRLVQILESMSDAFFTLDTDWRFSFLNTRAEQLLGRTADELRGKVVWDEFPDAIGTAFQTEYERAVASRQTVRFTEFYPAPLDIWFEVSAYPGPDGLAVYFRDVTEERVRNEQLQLLEAAVDRQNDILIITEAAPLDAPDGPRIVYANEALFRRTGYTREEVIGSTPRLLQGPRTQREPLDRLRTALEKCQHAQVELINYTRTGEEYWLEIDIAPVTDAEGNCTHFVAVERDVTERKAISERLAQSERLNAIGELTGGIAHDVNNLLTVILGNAELLAEQLSGQPQMKSLADMTAKAASRGAELTNRLLAFARRQPLEPRAVDANRLVAGMDGLLRRTLAMNIDIEVIRGGGLWPIEVDPGQLEVALLNLAINARDAMPDGGLLTIETANASLNEEYAALHTEVSPGQYVVISVSDTGTGMTADTVARAFDPFFTTKGVGKGNGLGLSMVYGFVKQSGGHATIYSEPGEGSSIRLYFPRGHEAGERRPPDTPEVELPGRGEHVLVVEDNELVREHLVGNLRELGYRVSAAGSAHDALQLVRQHPDLDLLFTDVVMPGGMNGRQLAEAVLKERPSMKVLYTSGYTENAIVHHGRLDQGVELLSKPYRRRELAIRLRRILDRPSQA